MADRMEIFINARDEATKVHKRMAQNISTANKRMATDVAKSQKVIYDAYGRVAVKAGKTAKRQKSDAGI